MLKGLKVIDASTVLAGPSVGSFFAELGADVIKVEHPVFKDVTRSWKLPMEDPDSPVSAYFSSINYLKEYLFLDLKDEKEREVFIQLISDADIFISNFKKGDDVKLGIPNDLLWKYNPKLIIGKITGYGQESDRVAYDLILQAESGFMSMNGTPESGPVKMPVALIDVMAAHHLKEGLLLALYERTKTHKGKAVNISLYDAAISSLVNQASNYLMSGKVPERIGSLHPNIAPYGELFKTLDGAYITFAIGSDQHFAKLCQVLGLDDLPMKDIFRTNQDRVAHRQELSDLIDEKVKEFVAEDLLNKLREINVPAGKVRDLSEVFNDPQAQKLIREEKIDGKLTKRITSVLFDK